jgi:hypothetical protein
LMVRESFYALKLNLGSRCFYRSVDHQQKSFPGVSDCEFVGRFDDNPNDHSEITRFQKC